MKVNLLNCEQVAAPFMQHYCGESGAFVPGQGRAIALLETDGVEVAEMIASVWYEAFNGFNVNIHVAAVPSRRWMTRSFLHLVFAFPFEQLGARRITGLVAESNLEARRFDEHIGFKLEARLKGAAHDGTDLLIYTMFKEDCRWLALGAAAKRRMH